MITSRSVLPIMRNFLDKSHRENENANFMFSNIFSKIVPSVRYLLTPWSRVLLEKLTASAASQEIPRIFETRRFLTVPTSARHLSLSWANSIQSPQLPLFCLQRKHLDLWVFLNMGFHGEALLAPRPTPKLEDHPSSAVHNCLLNLFADTLHIGGLYSIRNLRTRHAVVTGTHLPWVYEIQWKNR